MLHRDVSKSGLFREMLFVGSGVIIFVPLLLILVVALTPLTAFR